MYCIIRWAQWGGWDRHTGAGETGRVGQVRQTVWGTWDRHSGMGEKSIVGWGRQTQWSGWDRPQGVGETSKSRQVRNRRETSTEKHEISKARQVKKKKLQGNRWDKHDGTGETSTKKSCETSTRVQVRKVQLDVRQTLGDRWDKQIQMRTCSFQHSM